MRLFAVHSMLWSMVADQMHHTVNFAGMSKCYGVGRRTMMRRSCVRMENRRRRCQRCKRQLAGFKVRNNSLCVCGRLRAKSSHCHATEHK